MLRSLILALSMLIALPLWAAQVRVQPGPGSLANAIAGASPGDVLILAPGRHEGSITIDRPLTVTGGIDAIIDGMGAGTVVTINASDVTISDLTVTGSGMDSAALDAGAQRLVHIVGRAVPIRRVRGGRGLAAGCMRESRTHRLWGVGKGRAIS